MKQKLNLGCGNDIRPGYLNVDFISATGIDKVYDLNNYPYPFKDNSFEEILALDIIEHLDKPNEFIRELWRISKNNCRIKITTPHYSSSNAWGDLTHVRPFSQNSLDHYDIKGKVGKSLNDHHSKERFIVRTELLMPRLYTFLGIKYLSKKFPRVYQRFFTFIFPIQQITFYLICVKPSKQI